jgi:hypothetical protein
VRSLKLYVRGAGATWGYTLDEAFQGTLAVRVRLGTGVEWCGEGPPRLPVEQYDVVGKFWSAKDPPPAACQSLPGG